MGDVQQPAPDDRDELIWQLAQKRQSTQKEIAARFGIERSQVAEIIKRKRAQRNERIWQASCRGYTSAQLSEQFGVSATAIEKVVKKKVAEARRSEMESSDTLRAMRLALIRRVLPGYTQKVVDEADTGVSGGKPDPAIATIWLNLLRREAQYAGIDQANVTVSGDPENSLKIDALGVAQEILKMSIAAVKPWPGAGEAILAAMRQDPQEAETA